MDQVWKGLSNLDPGDPGGFYKKPPLSVNLSLLICQSWLQGRSRHVCGLWIDARIDDSCLDLNPLKVMANFINTGSNSTYDN